LDILDTNGSKIGKEKACADNSCFNHLEDHTLYGAQPFSGAFPSVPESGELWLYACKPKSQEEVTIS